MNERADVQSLEVLARVRSALVKFWEAASDALSSAEMETGHGLEWISQALPSEWKSELRRREQQVVEAQAELDRARMAIVRGEPPACTDQKVALAKAKRRREEAEDKLKLTKKWALKLEEEVRDYRLPTQQLTDFLAGEMPRALAEIDRMQAALAAYVSTPPPTVAEETRR